MTLSSAAGLQCSYIAKEFLAGWKKFGAKLTITDNSGTTSVSADHPDITFTRNSAGNYSVTYPPGALFRYRTTIVSAAGTITQSVLTAIAETSGTATLQFYGPTGSVVDGANGDIIHVAMEVNVGTE